MARDLALDLHLLSVIDQIAAPALVIGPDLRVHHLNAQMVDYLKPLTVVPSVTTLQDFICPSESCAFGGDTPHRTNARQVKLQHAGHTMSFVPLNDRPASEVGYIGIVLQTNTIADQNHALRWLEILSNLDEGAWDHDVATGNQFRSAGWRRMRGLAANDTSRDSRADWLRYVHPDDHAALDALSARIIAGKEPAFEISYREKHADGHWMWISSKGRVTRFDSDGRALHVVASNRDITDSHDVATRLQSIEAHAERWKIAVDCAGQGLWEHNLAAGTRYCSDVWRSIRGLACDDFSREAETNWLANIHPDDRAKLREDIAKIDRGETDEICYQYRERHNDGRYIWILSRGRVVSRTPAGEPEHIIGNDTDITTIKLHSEELEWVSKTLELAVTTAGIGVWEYNLNTRESKWDQQMFKLYGLEQGGPADTPDKWERHLHPDDKDMAISEANRCIKDGTEFNLDYRVVRPDKATRYVRSRAAHFQDRSGQNRLIGVNWDVTADRERAEVLRQANSLAQAQNKALEEARAKMEHDALHDALTGLANRRKLDDFEHMSNGYSSVLHIDLDRFKQINDTLGHAAGDQVIIHAANILRDAAPTDALVARVGGDEFVIFLPYNPGDCDLVKLATQIIQAAQEPVTIKGHECRFGMSVGIATAQGGTVKGTSLFANADMALYMAKNEGRGRFQFYTDDLKIAMQAKNRLADEILVGLENGEFFCIYQPQFDAHTLDLSGVEALVRWRHPDGKIRSPDTFLPVAEELNVVSRIDQIVLDQTISDTLKWQAAGLPVPRMSVNVSSKRLIDPDLPQKLECLRDAPGEFAFELLESVFLDTQDDQLAANLACIRGMGIDIEVDDFGTGHASIVGLLTLQPNRLKIDRALVGPVDKSAKQRLLIKSIVEIGKLQGIGVVAEGVETPAHISVLRDLGCDHLQGYGLASPMPGNQLMALLNAAHSTGKYSPYDGPKPAI